MSQTKDVMVSYSVGNERRGEKEQAKLGSTTAPAFVVESP